MELFSYSAEALEEERVALGATLEELCANIAARVRKTGYLEFGPYWWSVKRILNANGYEFGPSDDPLMAERFTVKHQNGEALTLIAAWVAADSIRATYYAKSRDVAIDDEGNDSYSLFDPDMEQSQ